ERVACARDAAPSPPAKNTLDSGAQHALQAGARNIDRPFARVSGANAAQVGARRVEAAIAGLDEERSDRLQAKLDNGSVEALAEHQRISLYLAVRASRHFLMVAGGSSASGL